MKMEIVFQRPGTCQRREGRDVPAAGRSRRASGGKVETCQRREGRDVPAAGRSRRASGGKRDVPAAGRSRRASGGKVETCQRRKVETCQRREGRDVPAAGKVETCQRGHQRGKVETCQRPGRSRRASGGHQRPPAAQSALSVFAQQSSIFGRSRIQLYRIYRLILQSRICGPERGNSVITLVDGALDTTVTTDNHVNPARIAIDGMTGI